MCITTVTQSSCCVSRLPLKKFELYQIRCQAVDVNAHVVHWQSLCLSASLSLSHSLPYLPLCLSLSDKLGDSLFYRKCSHHTDCRLVYSRFNLIIASPAFNQPASVCFTPKPCYKYKMDFDKRRLARLLSEKFNRDRRDKWGSNRKQNTLSVSLFWQFAPSLQEAKR